MFFFHSAPEYSPDESEPIGGYKDSGFWLGPQVGLCWGAQRDSGNPEYVGKVYSVSFIYKFTHISVFIGSSQQKSSCSVKMMYIMFF